MTYVINPWVFYFVSVADALHSIAVIALIVISVAAPFCWMESLEVPKQVFAAFFIALALAVFIPASETIYKMVVAQNVTYERVEAATDVVETVYEDIMALFGEEEADE